jgi:chitinase
MTTNQTAPTPTPPPSDSKTAKVIGYYAAWSAYSGFTPDKLDASKLTHINYAFANIGSDLKIAMGYPDIDPVEC